MEKKFKDYRLSDLVKKNYIKIKRSRVVIFGVSEDSSIVINEIMQLGGRIEFIIDNSKLQQQHKWLGYEIKDPSELMNDRKDICVIITKDHAYEKKRQILYYGISRNDILYFVPNQYNFKDRLIGMMKCLYVYNKIKSISNKYMLMCPYPGTGDAYITGLYLEGFIENKKIKNDEYTILVLGNGFKKILELYGYKNIKVISKEECDSIKALLCIMPSEFIKIYYLMYWGLPYQNVYRIEPIKGISFHELLKRSVFYNVKKIKYITYDKKSDKTKKIVIAPYANSFEMELPILFWEELIQKLSSLGYTVYTNCGNSKEQEIYGSIRLEMPYVEMFDFLNSCNYLIGVRSGLFDIFNDVNCYKIVLYQEYMSYERMKFFSLNNMYNRNDAVEYKLINESEYRVYLMNQIIENVMSNLK